VAVYWNLGLYARDRDSARACADYFRAQRLVLDGENIELHITDTEVPGGWLVGVWPRGMSYGIATRCPGRAFPSALHPYIRRLELIWHPSPNDDVGDVDARVLGIVHRRWRC
jgi:hypothetical protein